MSLVKREIEILQNGRLRETSTGESLYCPTRGGPCFGIACVAFRIEDYRGQTARCTIPGKAGSTYLGEIKEAKP